MDNTTLICKNIRIDNHRTSMRLETEMWGALQEIARRERCGMNDICEHVNGSRLGGLSLTAAVRLFAIGYFREAATEDGHVRAGHGSGSSILPHPFFPEHYERPQAAYMTLSGCEENR